MSNLDLFREKVTAARRRTGRLQRELADNLAISPQVLSRKLHGAKQTFLTHVEVKQIIRTLASWGAIVTREQAVELLDLMDCPHFSTADWESEPLSYLQSAPTKTVQSQIADEQIIYLSPEEELTNVRERLERTPARHIILVIPSQTQLRSHVSWRLLHSRTRELDKDVLVISPDRQIRSVAKTAGFRVVDSFESPASSSERPSSRAGLGSESSGSNEEILHQVPFHQQLRYERERRGWSQADLAGKVGCDTKTVGRWESGKALPRPYYRQAICELFGKNAEELGLAREDTKNEQYPTSPISLFISSKMQELVDERRAIQSTLAEYKMYGWRWEDEAGARPESIRSTYLAEVEACDIYIGLFWLGYGPYTIEEFEHARAHKKPCLIYEKYIDIDQRSPELTAFLERIQQIDSLVGLTVCRFETPQQLAGRVQADVMRLLTTMFRESRQQPARLSTIHDEDKQLEIQAAGGVTVTASSISGTIERVITEDYTSPTKQWQKPARPFLPRSFVGRKEELHVLIAEVVDGEGITITGTRIQVAIQGMGGIGKTYLARELAMELYDSFPGGVIWIDFGPQTIGEQSAQGLLRHLASYAFGGTPPVGRLYPDLVAAWLAEMAPGRLLVIFDDVWHQEPLRILSQALPTNTMQLVTTRDANIARALSGKVFMLDRLSLEDGLTLLEDRLGSERDDMEYRADLEKLVRMLDGHPLALDIAAALLAKRKIYQQPLKQLLENLERDVGHGYLANLRLPASEERDYGLEKSLALSYQLLDTERQRLFRILGAFSAGEPISVQAAATVWGAENQDTARTALFDLADLGLLTETEELEDLHYQLHPLLHSYARALLEREGELEQACWAHAQYYTDMSRRAVAATPRDYPLLDQHFQNILLALQWTSEKEPALFALLLDTVSQFLLLRGQVTLLETYLPKAVAAAQTVGNSRLSGSLLKSLGDLENRLGNIDQALAHYDAALPLCRIERDHLGEANVLRSLGDLERRLGNIDQARAHYDAALPLYRVERDRLGEANLLRSLGDLESHLDKFDEARQFYDAALPLYRMERDRLGEANLLTSLGDLERRLGNLDQARAHYDAALPLYRAERDRLGEANLLTSLGDLERRLGNIDQARQFYDAALPLYRMERARLGEVNLLLHLGNLERHLGNFSQARTYYEEVLPLYRQAGDRLGEANVLKAIGNTQLFFQDAGAALQSYEQALALYRQIRDRRGEATVYSAIGDVQKINNDLEGALSYYEQAFALYRQIGDQRGAADVQEAIAQLRPDTIEIFISYAHQDGRFRDQLEKQLSFLRQQGVTFWHDRMIAPGRELRREIDAHLNTAQIILLLVSADFLASEYCYNLELRRALERQEAGETRVIPILLRPVDLRGTPLENGSLSSSV
jgi:tetratricopeptide (TPR) repeat protein/transcriptional regulator with XRE-family HTH domain